MIRAQISGVNPHFVDVSSQAKVLRMPGGGFDVDLIVTELPQTSEEWLRATRHFRNHTTFVLIPEADWEQIEQKLMEADA